MLEITQSVRDSVTAIHNYAVDYLFYLMNSNVQITVYGKDIQLRFGIIHKYAQMNGMRRDACLSEDLTDSDGLKIPLSRIILSEHSARFGS